MWIANLKRWLIERHERCPGCGNVIPSMLAGYDSYLPGICPKCGFDDERGKIPSISPPKEAQKEMR